MQAPPVPDLDSSNPRKQEEAPVVGPAPLVSAIGACCYFVNLKRAVRGLLSPRSRFTVLQELAYVLGDFQLNW